MKAACEPAPAPFVHAALPFATGAECRTFGLRRYVRAGAAWTLASAASVGGCRDAAEALCAQTGFRDIALRCAELSVDVERRDGGVSLAGGASSS